MKSRIIKLIIAVLAVISLFGCGTRTPKTPVFSEESAVTSPEESSQEQPKLELNNLTGEYTLSKDAVGNRPVAVMINNIKTAQKVQSGLADADIIFESLAEGGITRLMAVYSDLSKVGQIGTIRSARYSYAQIALSLDAVYVHCGMDDINTRPYCNSVGMDFFDLGARGYYFREDNGLATEHTLYSKGETLMGGFVKTNLRTKTKEGFNTPYFVFNDPDSPKEFSSNRPNVINIPMSGSYITNFTFDSETNKFVRNIEGEPQLDCKTSEKTAVDNVLVLYDTYSQFEDGIHIKASLTSGEGVYFNAQGSCKVKWSKGNAENRFSLTDEAGNPFSMNAGTSWVAIVPTSGEVKVQQ